MEQAKEEIIFLVKKTPVYATMQLYNLSFRKQQTFQKKFKYFYIKLKKSEMAKNNPG